MTPTDEQQAVITHPLTPGNLLKVRAYAGAGKTSTLVEVARRHACPVLYLAFNKSVQLDALERFPVNVRSVTTHGLAYGEGKKYGTIQSRVPNWILSKAYNLKLYEASLLSKSFGTFLISADLKPSELHVAPDSLSRFQPRAYTNRMVDLLSDLWEDFISGTNNIPMTHDGYLKIFQIKKVPLNTPVILLDEAQDTNAVVLDIVLREVQHGAMAYIVGDPYQQIYGWRGALDAMTKVPAHELCITQSFRFGPRIAALASDLLFATFKETTPIRGLPGIDSTIGDVFDEKHTIICRTNAGLIANAYLLAKQSKPFHVIGEAAFKDTLDQLEQTYYLYIGKTNLLQHNKLSSFRSFKSYKEFAEESLDIEAQLKCKLIEDYGDSWPDVMQCINRHLTSVQKAHVTLTTTHKAKGLEWDTVKLANDFRELFYYDEESSAPDHQSRYKLKTLITDVQNEETELHPEEINLLYVALTRAKIKLDRNMDLQRLRWFVNEQRKTTPQTPSLSTHVG